MTYVGYTVAELAASFRERLLRALFLAKWSYFTRIPHGKLANSLSGEVKQAANAYLMTANLFSMQTQMLAYLIAGFIISWEAMLIAAVLGAGIALTLRVFIQASRRYGVKQTKHISNFISYLNDSLINIRPIKAMGKHEVMQSLLISRLAKVKKVQGKNVQVTEGMGNLNEALQASLLCGGFYIAVAVFKFPVGEIATIGLLVIQTMKYFSRALKQYQKIVNSLASYNNVTHLIHDCEAEAEENTGTLRQTLETEITLENISYAYDDRLVLKEVSLTVEKGQRVVLCGPSGSGKSTITDVVMGFIRPLTGDVKINGISLRETELATWRKQIGCVPQEPTLFNDSIFTNVTLLDPKLSEEDVWRALRMAGAEEFVRAMPDGGLYASVGERGNRLSGGQRQRIAIARALITSPNLLILDEVTSALDPESERQITQLIKSLDRSITIIAITHREALLDVADKVYHILDGTLKQHIRVCDT